MKYILKPLLFLALIASVEASDSSKFSLSPSGLRIVAPSYNDEDGMRAFNHAAGLNLIFDVISENRIESIDFSKSRVISVFDSTERDLISYGTKKENERTERRQFWSVPPSISEDGLACQIQTSIFSPFAPPAPNAKSITLTAELFVKTESEDILIPVELTYTLGLGN
jgi:hypothetical protein